MKKLPKRKTPEADPDSKDPYARDPGKKRTFFQNDLAQVAIDLKDLLECS